ncbi:MAG TPA: hypothetical protein VKR43_19455 [Bryobacteraceae bacterium]|nr:hypothetical protein [Bryobacteraceae bacterium]
MADALQFAAEFGAGAAEFLTGVHSGSQGLAMSFHAGFEGFVAHFARFAAHIASELPEIPTVIRHGKRGDNEK